MAHGDARLGDEVAQKLGGAQNMLGVLEGDGIERHGDRRLGVRADERRRLENNTKVQEKVAKEEEVARRQHAAKVLGLSTAQGNRLLRLGEPVEEATVIKYQAAADGESSAPVGIDEGVQPTGRIWREHQGPVATVAEIHEHTNACAKVRRAMEAEIEAVEMEIEVEDESDESGDDDGGSSADV